MKLLFDIDLDFGLEYKVNLGSLKRRKPCKKNTSTKRNSRPQTIVNRRTCLKGREYKSKKHFQYFMYNNKIYGKPEIQKRGGSEKRYTGLKIKNYD